jgi:tRNA pseudouridine13 synthase
LNAVPEQFVPIPRHQPAAWGGPAGTGRIRVEPEDFRVFEVPLVEPGGEGEHAWLKVSKRNSNTPWVAQQLADFAGVPLSAVSYAGLKDRRAVTEQWFSVHLPGRPDPDWTSLQREDFLVLAAQRHLRKLKTGTLRGNRFELRIRELDCDTQLLQQRLRQVSGGGFPNYFGPQRFGRDGGNIDEAARMFRQPRRRIARARRGIYLSAVRSALFNRVLAARVENGSWNQALPGEALQLEGKSACFVADVPDEETLQRLHELALHPTGPLCGDGESLCRGEALAFEQQQLQGWEGWIRALQQARVNASRRALRALPRELQWRAEGRDCGLLSFYLPAGCYATSLLDELIRVAADA